MRPRHLSAERPRRPELGDTCWRPEHRAQRGRAVCVGVSAPADLDGMLHRLHLPTVRRLHAELAARAEAEGMSDRDYLSVLVAEEVAHRVQTRIQRAVRRARFPFLKTINA